MTAYLRHRSEIAALLDPRCYTIEWLDEQIATGRFETFGCDRAVIVVDVRQYPAGAVELHGMVAAGEMASILTLIDQAEAWGRERGCTFASIASRDGWGRILRNRGYEPHQVEIRKEL